MQQLHATSSIRPQTLSQPQVDFPHLPLQLILKHLHRMVSILAQKRLHSTTMSAENFDCPLQVPPSTAIASSPVYSFVSFEKSVKLVLKTARFGFIIRPIAVIAIS